MRGALALFTLLALVAGTTAAARAGAPLTTDEHIRDGVTVTRGQCPALANAVWVSLRDRDFCIRYWLSTGGGRKDEVVVFLHGDVGGLIDGKIQVAPAARFITAATVQWDTDVNSGIYRGPFITIGRPGAFGSSGHHSHDRRTWLEFQVIDAALNAIKARYGFARLHLVGGHTVAALVRRRDDVGCAVMASAPLAVTSWLRWRGHGPQAGRLLYDPVDHVGPMQPRPGLRLIVMSDPDDKTVPFAVQREYVDRVRARGLPILHVTAAAQDERSHGLAGSAVLLAIDCAKGTDDQTLIVRHQTKAHPAMPLVAALAPAAPLPELRNDVTVTRQAPAVGPASAPATPPAPPGCERPLLAFISRSPCTAPEWPPLPRPAVKHLGLVRLVATDSKERVDTAFNVLRAQGPGVLGDRQALITLAKPGNGTSDYATIGPFATFAQANAVCKELKAAGAECVVQPLDSAP